MYSISGCIYNPTYTHPVKPRFLTLLRSREILANPVESITIMPGNLQSFQVQLSSALLSLSSREKWICCASSPKMIPAKSLDKKENKMKKPTGITVYGAHILCSVSSSIFFDGGQKKTFYLYDELAAVYSSKTRTSCNLQNEVQFRKLSFSLDDKCGI